VLAIIFATAVLTGLQKILIECMTYATNDKLSSQAQ